MLIRVPTDEDSINGDDSANGAAPNLVHSLDASHLVRTICRCIGVRGERMCFAAVHDSFATHARDSQALRGELRKAFQEIYGTEQDLLGHYLVLWSEKLPKPLSRKAKGIRDALLARGDLNTRDVDRAQDIFN